MTILAGIYEISIAGIVANQNQPRFTVSSQPRSLCVNRCSSGRLEFSHTHRHGLRSHSINIFAIVTLVKTTARNCWPGSNHETRSCFPQSEEICCRLAISGRPPRQACGLQSQKVTIGRCGWSVWGGYDLKCQVEVGGCSETLALRTGPLRHTDLNRVAGAARAGP